MPFKIISLQPTKAFKAFDIGEAMSIAEGRYIIYQLSKLPRLTKQEEKQLEMVKHVSPAAMHKLVTCNLRLVYHILCQYIPISHPYFEDFFQEASMGLIKAAQRFSLKRKVKFSSYASYWIKEAILRSFSTLMRMIHVPMNRDNIGKKLISFTKEYEREFGANPSMEEIADAVGLQVKDLVVIMKTILPAISLDAPVKNEDDDGEQERNGYNFIADNTYAPDRTVERNLWRDMLLLSGLVWQMTLRRLCRQ
jgi:RNA polymerase primary sigma factor